MMTIESDGLEAFADYPGEQYTPSNGTEGDGFIESWCSKCKRDKPMSEGKDFDSCEPDEVCEILALSYDGSAKEWRRHEGRTFCMAFLPMDAPPARREKTLELF